MLGKCIKNEIINRSGKVLTLSAGALFFSVIVLLFGKLSNAFNNTYMKIAFGIIVTVYVFAMIAIVSMQVFIPYTDFRERMYKDQGYLTHTLPVKMSTLIISRMIVDVITVTILAIIYPICICIATGNFEIFSDIIELISELLRATGNAADRSLLILDGILFVILMWLSVLFSIWCVNMAYSFGHAFPNSKRLISVVSYIVLIIAVMIFGELIGYISHAAGIDEMFIKSVDSIGSTLGQASVVLALANIVELLGVVLLAFGTGWLCKNKLNLE